MKILHLPTSVGGSPWGLAQAERAIGLDSTVLICESNWLDYKYDICLYKVDDSKLYKVFKRFIAFLQLRNKYDVYHFNFGSSLIDFARYGVHLWDLPFYRGKRIMTYQGCDARQKYPTMRRVRIAACHEKGCYGGMCNSGVLDKKRERRIKISAKYVDHMFALNPDLMYFLPKDQATFLPYSIAGWYEIKPVDYKIGKTLKILHAPTNREAKGSKYILNALEDLRRKYKNIEIIVVEKVPYKEALNLYQEAHIVIDQILVGWYGGFAVEVMKMGKPVGVFIREEDLKFIPEEMAKDLKETIININPFNIKLELSKYIENPELLYQKSQASIEYVNRWHNPLYIASLVKKVYES